MVKKITAATINGELKKLGVAERLVQGRGYVYFVDGDASGWFSSSVPVCYVSNLIVDGNLAATIARVLEERNSLANR